jgi:hypothetical protein
MFWICLIVLIYLLITITSAIESYKIGSKIRQIMEVNLPKEGLDVHVYCFVLVLILGWVHMLLYYVNRPALKMSFEEYISSFKEIGVGCEKRSDAKKWLEEYLK